MLRNISKPKKPIEELKEGMPEGHTLFYFYVFQTQACHKHGHSVA